MYNNLDEIKQYVYKNNSQSHLCICNTDLFEASIENGIYGFPHQGSSKTKSFWRAVASMYNIGPNDLIFIYRTKGDEPGCKEIHGPFKIKSVEEFPIIFYDFDSKFYPMKIKGITDCKVRFLFEKIIEDYSSISDNYELIKKFESKEIWGYRHPSVMNIGAARKKSVTSFTNKQTLLILDLLEQYGTIRGKSKYSSSTLNNLQYYESLNSINAFKLDDKFLTSSFTADEAFLYAYILRGLKTTKSILSNNLIQDFTEINKDLIDIPFKDMSINAMMEVIISPHLQDELDLVLMNKDDSRMLFIEVKEGIIDQSAINQTVKYIDLLSAIFPDRKVYANIVGSMKDYNAVIPFKRLDNIAIVEYKKAQKGIINFKKA